MRDFLNTFILVASHRSFSQASKLLGVSQPAISRQIKIMEEQVGQKLFSRSPHHVELTDQGRVLLRQVRPLMEKLNQLLAPSLETLTFVPGDIRVGSLSALGPFLDICISFQKSHPDCRTRLEYMGNDHLISAVKEGELDFAIGTRPPDSEEYRVFNLLDSSSVLVCSAKYKRHKWGAENSALPLLRYRFPGLYHQDPDSLVKPFLKKHGKSLGFKKAKFIFAVNSHYEMLHALKELRACAVLPVKVVANDLRDGKLIQVTDHAITKKVFLWHLTNPFMPVRLQTFKTFLLNVSR